MSPIVPDEQLQSGELPRVRVIALLVLLPCLLALGRFADPGFAVDDAWISFRTARTWLDGGGLTFDGSMPPVEGVTNLLWTLLSATWVAALPTVNPIGPARLLGSLLLLWTVWRAARFAAHLANDAGGDPTIAAAVTGLLIGVSGSLAFHALSGLETALWGALFLGVCVSLDSVLRRGEGGTLLGLLLMLLGATRPEGVLVAILVTGGLLARPGTRAIGLRTLAPVVLGLGAMEAFRIATYGSLVPNTFHAKPPDPAEGAVYVLKGVLYGTGGAGVLLALRAPMRGVLGPMGLCVGALAAGALWSGGDWMPGMRRLTLPLLWVGVAAGVAVSRARGRERFLSSLAISAWLAGNVAGGLTGWDSMRQAPTKAAIVARAAAATPAISTVALADVGVFGWEFDRSILDLIGLTDAHIATLPGAHGAKEWDESYFRARSPELVLVRSETPVQDPLLQQPTVGTSERPVLFSMLDGGGYRYHATVDLDRDLGRYLLIFARTDVNLPSEYWGEPARRSLKELLIELSQRQPTPR